MSILVEISENLQKGKAKIVKELVQKALDEGLSPEQILNEGLLHGMGIVGEKFKNNEVYVPEVLVSARAMNMGAQILKPHLAEAAGIRDKVKIMVGGAPVNQEFCDMIGADCYTVDAASAADAASEFCKA